jgi:hypothetical protein
MGLFLADIYDRIPVVGDCFAVCVFIRQYAFAE